MKYVKDLLYKHRSFIPIKLSEDDGCGDYIEVIFINSKIYIEKNKIFFDIFYKGLDNDIMPDNIKKYNETIKKHLEIHEIVNGFIKFTKDDFIMKLDIIMFLTELKINYEK